MQLVEWRDPIGCRTPASRPRRHRPRPRPHRLQRKCPSAAPVGGSITVYNAQHESLTQAWVDAFTEETGVKVILRNGDDSELGNQLVQEGAASPADVFLTENSPAMALVENAGLFAPVDAGDARPGARRLPAVDRRLDRDRGALDGLRLQPDPRLRGRQLPTSLLDLQDPAWKGRWAASPSGADFQAIVSALLALKGEDATEAWLAGMKTNFDRLPGQHDRS